MINIRLDDIKDFSKKYNANPENKKIEKQINKKGLIETCLNKEIIKENIPVFNIELSETKRYDQKESTRCWIFSGFNIIKRNMAENLNMNVMNLELSDNYIAFFHRLESANTIYEKIITMKKVNNENLKKILEKPIRESGNFKLFSNIVEKYGIVPIEVMPKTVEGQRYYHVGSIFAENIRRNALKLAQLKKDSKSIEQIRIIKKQLLEKDYDFLSKVYGEPKEKFDYEYIDNQNNKVKLRNLTPIEFKKQYLSINLKDFIFISNYPVWNRNYGTKYTDLSATNINNIKGTDWLHISASELKQLTIKQLKDKIPVGIGCYDHESFNYKNNKYGILDTRLYSYNKYFKYKKLNKEDRLTLNDIYLDHCMTITGVFIENNKAKRWKVEDSHGDADKINGYYVMNDNYFTDYVFTCIINKKYLSKKQLELYNQKSIIEK